MKPSLRVLAPDARMADSVRLMATVAAQASRPLVVTWASHRALAAELGSPQAASRFLVRLVVETGRPLLLNTPDPAAPATQNLTQVIAPPGWSHEKAAGYLAGLKDELAGTFGEVVGRPVVLAPPARPANSASAGRGEVETRQQRRERERRTRGRGGR